MELENQLINKFSRQVLLSNTSLADSSLKPMNKYIRLDYIKNDF